MNLKFIKISVLLVISTFFVFTINSCGDDDDSKGTSTAKSAVIENYANIVLASYQAALTDAETLEAAINTFVANPNQPNFTAARTAWITSRESYGVTEAYRFANGPIDSGDTEDLEGWLNSWPLDELFIDYVTGQSNAGIINDTSIALTKAELIGKNGENGEEANVSIGYHAIEFLLWGQDNPDSSDGLAGQRPYTDFADGGTAMNQDRRRQYLALCGDVLTDHLQEVTDLWKADGAYRAIFLALDKDVALKNIIGAIAELAGSELAVERMEVALQAQSQEDEHSCFSDNTHRDIRLNLDGVVNVYKGTFGAISGASIEDLITEKNGTLGASITSLLVTAETTMEEVHTPFDQAIVLPAEQPKVQTAVDALKDFSDELTAGAVAIGITL